jgi:predicted RNA binding protein YcfA (HicA-like mRNA interferase family)
LIELDGWYLTRRKENQRQYKHKTRKGLLTIAGKPEGELSAGTLSSIVKLVCSKNEIFDSH